MSAYRTANATVSAHAGVPVVTSNTTIFPITRALYVGVTGNITVHFQDQDQIVLFSNVAVGIFPVQVDQVLATGTTATSIVALY